MKLKKKKTIVRLCFTFTFIPIQCCFKMSTFKVVETIENGEKMLCVVPELWEQQRTLFWPPGRKGISLLRKDPASKPNKEMWSKQPCKLKQAGLQTFEAAVRQEKFLSQFFDTEGEEEFNTTNRERKGAPPAAPINFNSLIPHEFNSETVTVPVTSPSEDINVIKMPQDNIHYNMSLDNIHIEEIETEESVENNPYWLNNLNETIEELKISHGTIIENQKALYDEFLTFKRSVSGIHEKFDKLSQILIETSLAEKPINKEKTTIENDLEINLPVDSEEKLDWLECKLAEIEFRKEFVEILSAIGGKSGSKNGIKIAYMLMDRIFNREYLTKISWTGSSRQKDVPKISFLKYKYCIDCFFKIVNLADSRFTNEDLSSFFKRILKNANVRVNQKKMIKKKEKNIENNNSEEGESEPDNELSGISK